MYNIRKNLNYADAIGCTSHAMADQTRLVLGNPNQEIIVTPFGVNIEKCAPVDVVQKSDRPVIGIVKYLEPIYDIPLLINSFALLHNDAEIKPILKIYGDGTLKDELVELTRILKIEEDVGRKQNKPSLYPEHISEYWELVRDDILPKNGQMS